MLLGVTVVLLAMLTMPSRGVADTDYPGFDASLVHETNTHWRFDGANRYDASAKIALNGWGSSYYAVIASGETWPDGLVSAPLAKKYNCPILLTPKSAPRTEIKNALMALGTKYVFVVGGPNTIEEGVITAIKQSTYVTGHQRLWGSDRYWTAKAVADKIGYPTRGIVVTGENWPDALAVGSAAAYRSYPIILTATDSIPAGTAAALNAFPSGSKITIVGGTSSVSSAVESAINSSTYPKVSVLSRVAGSNRYSTAVEIVDYFAQIGQGDRAQVYLVTGENWPDALSVGARAGRYDEPILLTTTDVLRKETRDYLIDRQGQGHTTSVGGATLEVATNENIAQYRFVGGTATISHGQEFAVDALQWNGVKYVYGDEGPALDGDGPDPGFDCSGLCWYVIDYRSNDQRVAKGFGQGYPKLVNYPRVAADQQDWVYNDGVSDTVRHSSASITGHQWFYGDPAYHTGLFLSDGQMINAPDSGDRIRIMSLGTIAGANKYWSETWPFVEW